MTRTERTKLKRKIKRQYILAYSIGFGGFFIWVFIMYAFVAPISEPTTFNVLLIVMSMILPILLGLLFGMQASNNIHALRNVRRVLYDKQNKLHMKFFWDAIQAKDYEEAKRLYNLNDFIYGFERVLCNGILMGIASVKPIDENWSEKVVDRMNSYLK